MTNPPAFAIALADFARSLTADERTDYDVISARIYTALHCLVSGSTSAPYPIAPGEFVQTLRSANRGTGPWQRGWQVLGTLPEGLIEVARDGLHLWATPRQLRGSLEPGSIVEVRVANELRRISPGFYVTLGAADRGVREPHWRAYWHLRASGAAALVESLTATFNAAGIPFRFKVLTDPARYPRTDGGVLYVPNDATIDAWKAIEVVYAKHGAALIPATSVFVHAVAPGLGAADDVADGASFGQDRSTRAARIIVDLGDEATDANAVADRFRDSGIDPSRPFASAASTVTFPVWP